MAILDWKITSPIFYRAQTFNAFCYLQYQTKVLFEILFLRCIHMATFRTSSCTSSFLCIHYNILYSLWNVIQKKKKIQFSTPLWSYTFFKHALRIVAIFLTLNFSKKVFLFSVHAHICRCKIGLRFIDAMLKNLPEKQEYFLQKKEVFAHTLQK